MKLMATDFDGTLWIDNDISSETLTAIQKWRQAGHFFGIVTGRDQLMIHDKIKAYELDIDFLIGNNGAQVNGKIEKALFSTDILMLQESQLAEKSHHVLLFTEKEHLVVVNEPASKFYHKDYAGLKKLTADQLKLSEPVAQVSYQFARPADAYRCATKINENLGQRLQAFQNNECVDVVRAGIDKAVGLATYLAHQKETFDQVIVIGDGENDKELIETFQGYSLNHASPEVKALASGLVNSVGELISLVQ